MIQIATGKHAVFGVVVGIVIASAIVLGWFLGSRSSSRTRAEDALFQAAKQEEARRKAAEAAEEAARLQREKLAAEERRRLAELERRSAEEEKKRREVERLEQEERARIEARRMKESAVKKQREGMGEIGTKEQQKAFGLGGKISCVITSSVALDSEEGIGRQCGYLTEPGSLTLYYPLDGKLSSEACAFERTKKMVARSGGRKVEEDFYLLRTPDSLANALWCAYSYTNSETKEKVVLWQWRRGPERVKLFSKSEKADLASICFDGVMDGYEAWRKSFPGAVFVVELSGQELAVSKKEQQQRFIYVAKLEDRYCFRHSFDDSVSLLREKIDSLRKELCSLDATSLGFSPMDADNLENRVAELENARMDLESLHAKWKKCKEASRSKKLSDNVRDQNANEADRLNSRMQEIAEKWAVKKGDRYHVNNFLSYIDTMVKKLRELERAISSRKEKTVALKRRIEELIRDKERLGGTLASEDFHVSVSTGMPTDLKIGLNVPGLGLDDGPGNGR